MDEPPIPFPSLFFHVPDFVKSSLERGERASGTEEEGDQSDDGGGYRAFRWMGGNQHALNGFGAVPADEALDLGDDLTPGRLGPKDQPGNSNGDYQ